MRSGKILLSLTVAIIFLTLLSATPVHAQTDYNACGYNFTDNREGYGGVEICGLPYACGKADGVCPESYSSGPNETNKTIRTEPFVRYGEGYENPFDNSTFGYEVHNTYRSGDAACAALGAGSCSGMLEVNATGGTKVTSDVKCDDRTGNSTSNYPGDYPNTNKTYKAQCSQVPNVAGCENCPDPDCRTNITVAAQDTANNPVENEVTAVFTNQNNNQSFEIKTSGTSGYVKSDQAFTGYFNVTCGADFYSSTQTETYVQTGSSRALCTGMEAVGCSGPDDCQAPNEFGEYVCRSSCPECDQDDFIDQCEGRTNETYVNMGRENDTHVEYQRCCTNGTADYRYSPVANLTTGDISRFQVREIQRELDGEPVTVNVIVYDRD